MLRRALILLITPSGLAAAQAPAANADSATIAALEQRIEDAMTRRDAAFLDSVYAPTFRFKHSTGSMETRAQRMAGLRRDMPPDAPGRFIARVVDSLDVEVHGDVALTTGRIHVRRDGGEPRWRDYTVRYARIYQRHGSRGRWLLLTHHSTGESQGAPPALHQAAASQATRDSILAVLETFFATMTAKDTAAARRVLIPAGRFHAVGAQDGVAVIRSFTNEEYLLMLPGLRETPRERIWNPDVRVRGSIASVWTPYDFWLGHTFSHCGIDAFDLIRTPDGWKIAGGVYTVEDRCEPSPLGPLQP